MLKKAARKRAKRSRNDYIRILVFCLLIGGFLYTLVSQQINLISIRRETAQCKKEIAVQKDKYSRLKEKAEYNSSDEYYEDKARDEGYVRSDETVFIVGN